jgi:hypothetical protein
MGFKDGKDCFSKNVKDGFRMGAWRLRSQL